VAYRDGARNFYMCRAGGVTGGAGEPAGDAVAQAAWGLGKGAAEPTQMAAPPDRQLSPGHRIGSYTRPERRPWRLHHGLPRVRTILRAQCLLSFEKRGYVGLSNGR
jgi:hypothetical protein